MTRDTWTIIGTMVAIGVLLSGIVINQNNHLNTRINYMQDRIDSGFDNVNQRFNDANQRMSDGFENLQRQVNELQTDIRELRSIQFENLKNKPGRQLRLSEGVLRGPPVSSAPAASSKTRHHARPR